MAPGIRIVPASEADWRALVERVLDGRPFESLASTTFEGLKIAPLYPRATNEGARALRQHHGPWKISQRMDHPEPEIANQMARADLDGGADALTLTVSEVHSARGFGVRIDGEPGLDAVLAGIDLDLISLRCGRARSTSRLLLPQSPETAAVPEPSPPPPSEGSIAIETCRTGH